MPKTEGGFSQRSGKCWNDTYEPHHVTTGAISAVLRASTLKSKGRNGAAVLARIKYMRRAMNVGLVKAENMTRAVNTLINLEEQLCEEQ